METENKLEKVKRNSYYLQPNKGSLLSDGLQYRDVLTYGTLISFCNKDHICWPSVLGVSKRSKLSRPFVIASLKRLSNSKWITIEKDEFNRPVYRCEPFKDFKMIPMEIFESSLPPDLIAILLCIRQFYYDGNMMTNISISQMALLTGIPRQTLNEKMRRLRALGYLKDIIINEEISTQLIAKDFEWMVDVVKKNTEDIAFQRAELNDMKELLKEMVKNMNKTNQDVTYVKQILRKTKNLTLD